jgi:hypothetical protein
VPSSVDFINLSSRIFHLVSRGSKYQGIEAAAARKPEPETRNLELRTEN